jgi:DNA-binding transcriptional MerR regulator
MRQMDDLLTIGRFGRLAGLSVGALRHYDELDLLRPARTDPFTNYRLYARGQLETARMIVRLRDLEVPLETIRDFLATDDPAQRRQPDGRRRGPGRSLEGQGHRRPGRHRRHG